MSDVPQKLVSAFILEFDTTEIWYYVSKLSLNNKYDQISEVIPNSIPIGLLKVDRKFEIHSLLLTIRVNAR